MIELKLNRWFLVQLFNFLTLVILLYFLLFKPLLNLLRERAEKIATSLEEARRIQKRSEQAMSELDSEIAAAKEKARNLFLKFQKEGFDEQKRILEKAKEDSTGIIEKAKVKLMEDTGKARTFLREESGRLSLIIAKKLLSRELYR